MKVCPSIITQLQESFTPSFELSYIIKSINDKEYFDVAEMSYLLNEDFYGNPEAEIEDSYAVYEQIVNKLTHLLGEKEITLTPSQVFLHQLGFRISHSVLKSLTSEINKEHYSQLVAKSLIQKPIAVSPFLASRIELSLELKANLYRVKFNGIFYNLWFMPTDKEALNKFINATIAPEKASGEIFQLINHEIYFNITNLANQYKQKNLNFLLFNHIHKPSISVEVVSPWLFKQLQANNEVVVETDEFGFLWITELSGDYRETPLFKKIMPNLEIK